MTTHATIHHINAETMAVEFDYSKDLKDKIKSMDGARWDKSSKCWLLPITRLSEVAKLFHHNVTVADEVLLARTEQLKRMFRQYHKMGVTFRLEGKKVRCDHAVLDQWFFDNGNKLHAVALEVILAEPQPAPAAIPQVDYPIADQDDPGLTIWLRGVKNARVAEEKKAAMLAAKKRKRVVA